MDLWPRCIKEVNPRSTRSKLWQPHQSPAQGSKQVQTLRDAGLPRASSFGSLHALPDFQAPRFKEGPRQ